MYCPDCGAEIPDRARFCGNCGRSLSGKNSNPEGSRFLSSLLWNLGLLLALGVILFVAFPDIMRQVSQVYALVFGPVVIILLVLAAARPRRRRRRR